MSWQRNLWILAWLVLAVPAALLAQGSDRAGARDAAPGESQELQRLDQNRDGFVESDEVPRNERRRVERLVERGDEDGDGQLSAEEFAAVSQPQERPERDQPPADNGGGFPINLGAFINPQMIFSRLDANSDQRITMDEIPEDRQLFEALLQRADRNQDGAVDRIEFLQTWQNIAGLFATLIGQMQTEQRGAMADVGLFEALDTDRDNVLSQQEIQAAPQVLSRLDRNGDGALALGELLGGRRPLLGLLNGRGGRGRAADGAEDRSLRRFLAFDEDNDGRLSQEEAPALLQRRFEQLDADGDGFLDRDELRDVRGRGEPRDRGREREDRRERAREFETQLAPPDGRGFGAETR